MSKYTKTISSFSGSDMVVQLVFPGATPVAIGTASTVSYSIFREKRQVRTLGRISAKGITKGPRTVGGTLIFTVIHEHVLRSIMRSISKSNSSLYGGYGKMKPDELPPFDLIVSFANEYGQIAKLVIYGVTILDDNMTLSIEDMFTENTMTYIARDVYIMEDVSDSAGIGGPSSSILRGSDEPIGTFTVAHSSSAQALADAGTLAQQLAVKYSI